MKVEDLDTSHVDALDDLVRTEGWRLYRQRLEMQLDRDSAYIEAYQPEHLTNIARGRIQSLRLALNLPKLLAAEIAAQIAQEK